MFAELRKLLYILYLFLSRLRPDREQDADQKHDTHRKGHPGKIRRANGLQHADQEIAGQADSCDDEHIRQLRGHVVYMLTMPACGSHDRRIGDR